MEKTIVEKWKDIVGYEGMYQISNIGRVRSLPRKVRNKHSFRMIDGCILSQSKGNSGYLHVTFSVVRTSKSYDVHRLVALSFLEDADVSKTVNHKDGIKTNNVFTNLEMITQAENNLHKILVLGKSNTGEKTGDKNPMFGKKHSEETKEKIRTAKLKYYEAMRNL